MCAASASASRRFATSPPVVVVKRNVQQIRTSAPTAQKPKKPSPPTMGKSKFPGKPSRLVNKKRVSVLSPAGLTLSDEDNQEGSIQHQHQQQQQQQMLATAAAAASSAVANAAAGSPSPTRTCEKPSTAFPLQQRKESTAGASSGTAAAAAAKSSATASSSSLENGRHGDNDDDVHQLAASKVRMACSFSLYCHTRGLPR